MILIKIISKSEAIKIGLTQNKKSGNAVAGIGCMVLKENGKKELIMEKYILKENGKKELIFMSKDRAKHLKTKKQFNKYLKQFNKVEGIEK